MSKFKEDIECPNVKQIIGVYGIYNTSTDDWEYIGQSKDVYYRFLSHVALTFKNVYDLEFYVFYEFDSYDLKSMLYYESLLINELNPRLNIAQQQCFLKNDHIEVEFINKNVTTDFLRFFSQSMLRSQIFKNNLHKAAIIKNKKLRREISTLQNYLRKNHIDYKSQEFIRKYKLY